MTVCDEGVSERDAAKNFVRDVSLGLRKYGHWGGIEANVYGPATGFVYFITIGDPYPTHIKIGFTGKNPFARMRELQTGCPFKMKMFGYVFGNTDMERELHDVFCRDRREGEWFEWSDHIETNLHWILDR